MGSSNPSIEGYNGQNGIDFQSSAQACNTDQRL
jgi:oligoribonuclease